MAAPAAVPPPPSADLAVGKPWQGVDWTIPLVGLLVYIWSVTTYRLPLGQESMIVALVGLLFVREPLRLPRFLLLFGLFFLWCALGLLHTSYWNAVTTALEVLGKVWLIAFVVVNALRTRAQQRVFMFVALAAFATYPLRGALFNYVGGYTVFGRAIWNYAYENPNDLAAIALLFLGLTAALFVREPRSWPKLAALIGLVLVPLLILLTQSRAAILAMGLFAILLVVQQQRRIRTLAGIAAVGLVAAFFAPDSLWDRLGGLTKATDTSQLSEVDETGSAEQRYAIWQVAKHIAGENPVLGVGFGAYKWAHGQTVGRVGLAHIAGGNRSSHSTYLQVLAETGVPGMALWLAVMLPVLVSAESVRRRARATLPRSAQQILYTQLGLIAFLLAGIFGSFAQVSFTYIMLALLWTIVDTTREELARTTPRMARVA